MTIDLHKWTSADRESLMALCNAVDRTFLSDRLPYPYTEADADWWLGMVARNDGTEAVRQICGIAFGGLPSSHDEMAAGFVWFFELFSAKSSKNFGI